MIRDSAAGIEADFRSAIGWHDGFLFAASRNHLDGRRQAVASHDRTSLSQVAKPVNG